MSIKDKERYPLVDQLRLIAILMMIFYHLFYDMNLFGFVRIDFFNDIFWFSVPRIIVFLFLFCVGISLHIVHSKKIKIVAFIKKISIISILAALITVTTYFMFPKSWIYFGTLHCILVSSILGLPFVKFPKTGFILGLLIITLNFTSYKIEWFELPHLSMDYIPLTPWVSIVLLGIFFAHKNMHQVNTQIPKVQSTIKYISKHSLLIYIFHQPILYSLVYLSFLICK